MMKAIELRKGDKFRRTKSYNWNWDKMCIEIDEKHTDMIYTAVKRSRFSWLGPSIGNEPFILAENKSGSRCGVPLYDEVELIQYRLF